MKDRYLRALAGVNEEIPPVWIMRQAGRYLPSYQKIRARYELIEMFHNPEIIAEVTDLPLELGVDAAIIFSDIMIIAEALGLKLFFQEGPRVYPEVTSVQDLAPVPVEKALFFIRKAIEMLKRTLDLPLIGFCGGPFTVATYLISGGQKSAQKWLEQDPKRLHAILEAITAVSIEYLQMQMESGVDAIQIFDSWADRLSPRQFQEFSLPYLEKMVHAVQEKNIPVTLFCRGSSLRAAELATLSPNAISFDWLRDLSAIAKELPEGIALQGNLNPEVLLYQSVEEVEQATQKMLRAMKGKKNYIVNLGHGVLPNTPLENVKAFLNAVKKTPSSIA